jgi:hypothetical protein
MPGVCKCFGSSFAATTIAAGKRGPVKKPSSETATADTTNFGTSQNTSSKAIEITR